MAPHFTKRDYGWPVAVCFNPPDRARTRTLPNLGTIYRLIDWLQLTRRFSHER
jgi:hypothetical protein